jgi:thiol-activated cytolysin
MMQKPSLSAFREERNRILTTTLNGATTALVDYRIEDISSEPQLSFVLGAGFPLRGILDITSGFDFTKTGKKSRVLLDFTQIYYTFDVDAPRRPADFFTTSLSAAALDGLLTKGEPPVYVQSIYFGRRILVAFESSESTTTLHAAVKAAAEKLKVGGNVDAKSVTVLKSTSTKAVVIGGSGASAAMAITNGLDGITSLIQMGGNYSKDSPGAPIAYQLAYLDNVPMKMVLASDYVDTTCTRTSATVRASLDSITNLSDDIGIGTEGEFYGTVRVILPSSTHDGSCPAAGAGVDSISLMSYGPGMYYQPGETHEGSKADLAIGAGKYICLEAKLLESDPGYVDDYGFVQRQLPWGEWEGTHTLQLRNATNAADVAITITLP